jgi:ADP-ribosylglycohydrolase
MLGAIAGDVIGSVYEFNNVKTTRFPLFSAGSAFTDDTVLTVAVADAFLDGQDYAASIRRYARAYPGRGYGGRFRDWVASDSAGPYQSLGNGSAMRVSPVAFALDSEAAVLSEARATAVVTHDHPEGIKGAQAVALAVFLARTTHDKALIKRRVSAEFGYDLSRSVSGIRPDYRFDETCPGSVPEALTAFLESTSFEDSIRLAVSLGGDSDTIACITGSVAEAFYGGVPEPIRSEVLKRLPTPFISVLNSFPSR